jgi:hypothetical protein
MHADACFKDGSRIAVIGGGPAGSISLCNVRVF